MAIAFEEAAQIPPTPELTSPEAIAHTLEVFAQGQLLARAMDTPMAMMRYDGLDFYRLDEEMARMSKDTGMDHVSTTLLMPGERIPTYKAVGFLVDSESTVVEHVAEVDSGSYVENDGSLAAFSTGLTSLAELADIMRTTHSTHMNEVNVTIPTAALRGLFTHPNERLQFEVAVMQRHLAQTGHGVLPIFIYNETTGSLQPWQPSSEEITTLFDTVGQRINPKFRASYAAELGIA